MADAFGGSRIQARPPERGVFALDHDGEKKLWMLLFIFSYKLLEIRIITLMSSGECKAHMKSYLGCLKEKKGDHVDCRELSKNYLQCRMDHELMSKEDMARLGFGDKAEYIRVTPKCKEAEGFVAGLGVETGGGTKKIFKW